MDYQELLKRLFSLRPDSSRRDLSIAWGLAELLGHPERAAAFVHVGGTNGKGSVTAKIAHALELCGLRVGRYISPHLLSYEERITINGEKISKEDVLRGLQPLFDFEGANFFELTTFLAFDYFRKQKVDVAVIEVGLGGALDPTNVISPLLSIITSISLDHTQLLGKTTKEIALEKAGIIKPGIPVVVGPAAYLPEIIQKAESLKSPLYHSTIQSRFYELENRATARLALSLLKPHFPLTDSHIEEGVNMRLPCRFEEREGVIFDVAHNPDGFRRLIQALKEQYPDYSYRFVVGMSADKDVRQCLEQIVEFSSYIHCVQADYYRALPVDQINRILKGYPRFSLETTVASGLKKALAVKQDREKVVVCGSFYAVSEALLTLNQLKCEGGVVS